MIREAVETLGPPGAMRPEEAVLATLGPEPVHEAQEIIEGIQASRPLRPRPDVATLRWAHARPRRLPLSHR